LSLIRKRLSLCANSTDEAGRAVAKYLRDGIAFCTIIDVDVIKAILDVNFPLDVYIALNRKEGQLISTTVKELDAKDINYIIDTFYF
jgi:hypothetical protein